MGSQQSSTRVFLFLQGPSSPIFAKIAAWLEAKGHRCLRINLNPGDQIFWRRKGSYNYRGRGGESWRAYAGSFMDRHAITDLILLGEERPYHQLAIAAARERNIAVSVIEMGYLRPDWLTLERGGMSSNSHFPVAAQQIVEAARTLPEPDWNRHYAQSFLAEASYDLLYNLPNVFLWFLFPHYRRHALFHPLAEYAGWVIRLAGSGRREREASQLVDSCLEREKPFFIYPLQLQTDFQLRAHSPYNDQREAIGQILTSFARHAAPDTQLLVKIHPLDNGLINWRKHVADLAVRLNVGERVHVLDGGNLNALLERAQGTVTVNSTVGLHALQLGKPVKVLGAAVFDIAGLSDQAPLEQFWRTPEPPEASLRSAFFRLLAASIQVRGNFYSTAGTDAGAAAIAERLHNRSLNQPGAFIDPPPRKKPAKIAPRGH
ncbi:capsular biosynthesis protein [Rhizobium herbae]|uniref:Capsular biosynthesis protein n=1 Tax=Rhizobium herbae TaxID=508661 RepID=A0ABS7H9X7_9HYPH|nr:capsular biosynthesis protein [Rhizobium herbae]MBW9063615.1 capsular biosynthesis protein [Rhizobium herbae]